MKDAIEKEMGEYRRECEYFSHSRLEETDCEDTLHDPDTFANGEAEIATEASEATAPENPSETVTLEEGKGTDGGEGADPSSKADTSQKKSLLERQVVRLLAQVNGVSWNHSEFRVRYHSLTAEPRVGNYFLRLLLEEDKRFGSVDPNAADADGTSKMGLSRIKNR